MRELGRIVYLGLMAGVLGTGTGGLLLSYLKRPRDDFLGFLLAFSGGIMLAVVFQDLILEALSLGGVLITLAGIIFGVLILFLLSKPAVLARRPDHDLVMTGLFVGLGISLHNFPEGLAIGAGYTASQDLGFSLALAICIHNIPEGMAMAAPLLAGGLNRTRVVLMTISAGIPMGIGALLGGLLKSLPKNTLAGALGCAAGAMLFLVFYELLPEALRQSSPAISTFGAIMGIIVGLVFLVSL